MQVKIWLASLPPPIASKAMVAPVSTSACVSSSAKVAEFESTTCFAPMPYNSLACSALRTMFTRPMPSSWQILFSIWPRFDAAAVCTSALWPSRFIVSVMPSAVSGLTNHEAPSAAVVPAGRGWQSVAFRSRYCAYIAPPIIDTILPSSACSATLAVILMAAPFPEALAVLMSAGPSSKPRSDGLIGVASTLTNTWSGPGSGISTSANDSSSSPLFLIRERSCNPFVVPLMSTSPLYPFMRPLLVAHPAAGESASVTGLSRCDAEDFGPGQIAGVRGELTERGRHTKPVTTTDIANTASIVGIRHLVSVRQHSLLILRRDPDDSITAGFDQPFQD